MKRLFVVAVLSLLFLANEAAAQLYVQTVAPAPYVPLANLPGIQNITPFTFTDDDEGSATIPIPFAFNYLGQPYNEVRVSTNGYLVFGQGTDFGSYFNYPIGSPDGADNVIAVWWDDLVVRATAGYSSYGTIGTAPNRIFVIEVRDWEHYSLQNIADGSWQVWLYEGVSGRFDVRADGELDASEFYSATSGWEGPNGVPFGAFLPCSNNADCDHVDFAMLRGNVFSVEQAQGPELTGAVGVFPRGALPGGSAIGQVTLRNLGTEPANNVRSDLRLSLDARLDASDILVASWNTPRLDPGNVPVTLTATVTVPPSTPPGDYYLLLVVDSNDTVPETSEANNVVAAPARFATAYDLQPIDGLSIDGANPGGTLMLDVEIGNQGVLYTGAATLRVYGSLNTIFEAGIDPLLGTASVNLSGSLVESFTVPLALQNVAPGSYYAVVQIDPNNAIVEYDEANNTALGSARFPIGPELIITDVASPGGADPGQPITFMVTVQNDGVPYAGNVQIRFLASPDPIFDVNDPVLGLTTITLAGLFSETLPATITMPPLPAGVYYPIALLDPNNLIAEGNDFNNTAVSTDVFTSGPDFVITDVDGPTQATPGQPMMVTTTIGSIGAPFTGTVPYRLYLSADRNFDAQDVAIGDYTVTFAGQTEQADARMPVFPPTLPPTGHYLIAVVDPLGVLPEAAEGNNRFIDDQRIGSGTDFTVYSVDFTPSSVRPGEPAFVDFILSAEGTPYLGPVEYAIWLSRDSYLDATDLRLLDGVVTVMGEGTYSVTASITIGPTIPPGSYEFIVEADPDNLIVEPSDTNNWDNSFFEIDVEGPNLVATAVIVAPQAFVGIPYRVELTVANVDLADAAGFRYGYYYTTNGLLRPPDGIELFTASTGPIPAGGSRTIVDMIEIPPQPVPSRFVQLGVILDLDNAVLETDEPDNVTFAPGQIQILEPVSDLWVRIDDAPLEAAGGEDLAITRTLQNVGVADSPSFTYAYYLSANETISPADDILIGSFTAQLPLDGYDRSIEIVNLPATVPPGTYYLGLVADPADAVLETNEINNVALGPQIRVFAAALSVHTSELPAATLGAPYRTQLFATGAFSDRTWSITNGSLPPGLALDQLQGTIAGTPTEDGLYPFTVRVTSGNAYAERALALRVRDATVPIEVLSLQLPFAIAGRPYATELVAVGGATPYSWGVRSALPPGLTATSTGSIAGTPTQAGSYLLAVVVTDAEGAAATADVALEVISPDQTLTITPSPLPTAVLGEEYCNPETIKLFASGGFPPYEWSSLSPLPRGMTLGSDGALCGVPEEVGDFGLILRAEDAAGVFDTSLFILRVRGDDDLAITVTALQDARVGEMYTSKLTARLGVEPYRWRISDGALPAGLSLSEDGTISGVPSMVETTVFVVEVMDASMQAKLQPLSLRVIDGDGADGCGCSAAGAATGSPWLLLLLIGLGMTHRLASRWTSNGIKTSRSS